MIFQPNYLHSIKAVLFEEAIPFEQKKKRHSVVFREAVQKQTPSSPPPFVTEIHPAR